MVVRATIRALVHQVPYSDRLPERLKSLMGYESSEITEIEISPDEVRPLATPSQKIRMRILEKRILDTPLSPLLPKSGSGLDSSRDSGQGLVDGDSNIDVNGDYDGDDGENTLKDMDSQNLRQARVESYLTEQHDEFTSLIDKNLKEVIQQQQQHEPSWRRLVVELAMARSGEEAAQNVVSLASKAQDSVYALVPFIRSESHTQRLMAENESSALKLETTELLDQLDYNAKVTLLRQLMVDLGMQANPDDIVHFTRSSSVSEDTSMAEKLELLALVAVRLSFMGLRFFLPITKLLYTKFKENDIVLVNNKNFSRFLTMLVRVLESVEEKLNTQTSRPNSADSHTSTETTG